MSKETSNMFDFALNEVSEQSDSTGYRLLDNAEIERLYTSYNSMKAFCEQLSMGQILSRSQILEKYAGKAARMDLLPKNVMHILDKRIQRMLKNKKLKKNWSGLDTQILYWTFTHYSKLYGISSVEETTIKDWKNIAMLIPGSTEDSCMFKILGLKKINLAQQKWAQQESALLLEIGMKYEKKKWRLIAQELYKMNTVGNKIFRNAKQCKQHWVCYLNPQLKKGYWNLEEDKQLLHLIIEKKGCRKWAQIAKVFGGRTENALKNRYTLIIERLRREKTSLNDLELIEDYLYTLEKRFQGPTNLLSQDIFQGKQAYKKEEINKVSGEKKIQTVQKLEESQDAYQREGNFSFQFPQLFQMNSTMPFLPANEQTTKCLPVYFDPSQLYWIFPDSNIRSQ